MSRKSKKLKWSFKKKEKQHSAKGNDNNHSYEINSDGGPTLTVWLGSGGRDFSVELFSWTFNSVKSAKIVAELIENG